MTDAHDGRNVRMAERIGATPVRYPFSFVMAGDSGAWPDPTADAIFAALVAQTAWLEPAPVFFANLGDFAGPGTVERHEHYLGLVWARVHGPANFQFGYGHTRFIAIDAAPEQSGRPRWPRGKEPQGRGRPPPSRTAWC